MRYRSIRFRLTAWYFAVLAVTLVVYGCGMWFAMQHSIRHGIDEALEDRLEAVQRYMEEWVPRRSIEFIGKELREHSGFGPDSDLLQIQAGNGEWIYRSRSAGDLPFSVPAENLSRRRHFETVANAGEHYRVLTQVVPVHDEFYTIQVGTPIGEYEEVLGRFGWTVVFTLPLALLVASLGGYWMSRRALEPVDEITRQARSISARNLSRRLPVPATGDELARLSETLNGMMERLETAFRKMTRFTADASHELRTPVAVMRTTAELALRRERPEEEYRDALRQILAELERTSKLIENMLILARADSGTGRLQFAPMDLARCFREASEQGRLLAEARQVEYRSSAPDNEIRLVGDAGALHRLFLILIDNAVKYTPAGGSISVTLRVSGQEAVAEVKDTGIGISRDDLPHIFERFYRADKARSRDEGGAGLGLSIARWIAEAHHGSIQVESTVGRGSTFSVHLPLTES